MYHFVYHFDILIPECITLGCGWRYYNWILTDMHKHLEHNPTSPHQWTVRPLWQRPISVAKVLQSTPMPLTGGDQPAHRGVANSSCHHGLQGRGILHWLILANIGGQEAGILGWGLDRWQLCYIWYIYVGVGEHSEILFPSVVVQSIKPPHSFVLYWLCLYFLHHVTPNCIYGIPGWSLIQTQTRLKPA